MKKLNNYLTLIPLHFERKPKISPFFQIEKGFGGMILKYIFFTIFLFTFHFLQGKSIFNDTLYFQHFFNGQKLELDVPLITTQNDTIYISKLQYYVGNFELDDKKLKSNYFLIKSDDFNSQKIILKKKYKEKLKFYIGISEKDNQQNSKNLKQEALDLSQGMFWTWESGYIFFKLEGYFFVNGEKKGLIFHLGRKECFTPLEFYPKKENNIIKVDMSQFFPPQKLSDWTKNKGVSVMIGEEAAKWAERLKKVFK
jgi:hypothetical protein